MVCASPLRLKKVATSAGLGDACGSLVSMAIWEYKVITSGVHGFASLSLLETHLNALGKDEWEIINFQTQPNNPLAFHGLARRSTMRDWTPPEITAAAAAPPAPAKSAYEPAPKPAVEEKTELTPAAAEELETPRPAGQQASLRPMRNTDRDLDPDAEDDEDWDEWEAQEDELPTLFDAIKPHLRRNQKGPGMSVAVDYLAKRWEQKEADIVGALKECGFVLPETEDAEPEYFEFEGDLYWINRNNRGQFFLNTREKPRPVFRVAPVKKLAADDPAAAELANERAAERAEIDKRKNERLERERQAAAAKEARAAERAAANPAPTETAAAPASSEPLPAGPELLDKIRPMMRRNRRGPGYSGSTSFLARALRQSEADLTAAFAALGLTAPATPGEKPVFVEIAGCVYWMNKDNRGGIWINGREKKDGPAESDESGSGTAEASSSEPTTPRTDAESAAQPAIASSTAGGSESAELPFADSSAPQEDSRESDSTPATPASDTDAPPHPVFSGVRLLLTPNKRGSGVSGEVGYLARTLGKAEDEFVSTLTGAGLAVPADSEAKPVFVEHAGEIFWLNKNPKDGSVWLNAKAAKSARRSSGGGRSRSRKAKAE